jgi:hypothetical protein
MINVREYRRDNQKWTIQRNGQHIAGADPGFQVRRAHLKKLRRAEGGANIFGVFRVKNHDFTPKNHIFFNGGSAPVLHTRRRKTKQKHNTICVGHHYTQANTNNVS